jgi:hypothetical protein
MPKYRLLSAHYSEEDKWLPGDKENEDTSAPVTGNVVDEDGNQLYHDNGQPRVYRGTIVGDGTQHKWTRPPTPEMEGLDEKSKALVEEARKRGDGLNPIDFLPLTTGNSPNNRAELEAAAERMGFSLVEKEDA